MARGSILTETRVQEFFVETCCACGVEFAMTQQFKGERVKDKYNFYCPNGHEQCYMGTSYKEQVATLTAEKTALQVRIESERQRTAHAEAARARETAKRKRIENRVAKGVCPYCSRSFVESRMAKHIHTKHPEKAHE